MPLCINGSTPDLTPDKPNGNRDRDCSGPREWRSHGYRHGGGRGPFWKTSSARRKRHQEIKLEDSPDPEPQVHVTDRPPHYSPHDEGP
jgi:hypothetical protein